MITKDSLRKDIFEALKNKPKEWRDGQFIFNWVYDNLGVAVNAQNRGVDCYYDDSKIDDFIDCCYNILTGVQ